MKYFVQQRSTVRQRFVVEASSEHEARKLVRNGDVLAYGDPTGKAVIEYAWPLADQTLEAGNINPEAESPPEPQA